MTSRVAFAVLTALASATISCNDTFRFDEQSVPRPDAGADRDAAGTGSRCNTDADCTVLDLRCELSSGRCVACLGDDDCAAPAPRCSPSLRVCVECLDTADCTEKQRCHSDTMRCVDTCAEGDERCPVAGFSCDEHAELCIECRTSSHCTGNPHGSRCAAAVGRCVECLGNAQCPAERPKCDLRRGTCAACVASSDCPPGQACPPSTSTCTPVP